MIDQLIKNNQAFVAGKDYEKHITDGLPSGKTLVLTCMDTRLSVMLPEALGIKNGEVKIVKVAGGVILDDYDAVMRSILVGIYELGIEEIMVIHHTDCGAGKMNGHHMEQLISQRIPKEKVALAEQHVDISTCSTALAIQSKASRQQWPESKITHWCLTTSSSVVLSSTLSREP